MQATSRRPFIVNVRFKSQAKPYVTYIGKVVMGNVFLRVIYFSHVSIISIYLHLFRLPPTLCNVNNSQRRYIKHFLCHPSPAPLLLWDVFSL